MKQGTARDIFEQSLNDLKKLYPELTLLYTSR